MEQIVTKILDILDSCDNAIEIAQIVLMAVISHRCGKTEKAIGRTGIVNAAPPAGATVAAPVCEASAEEEKPVRSKKQLQDYISQGIALYFSGKEVDDMTEMEQAKYNAAKAFIEEV